MYSIVAGQETTAGAVLWALLLVAAHPAIGARVRDEIEHAIGTKEASTADRSELPFTDSVLSETLRFSGLVPIAAHRALADVELRDGSVIPAGANIIGNLFSVQHDERYWPEPYSFDPEANFPPGRDKEKEGSGASCIAILLIYLLGNPVHNKISITFPIDGVGRFPFPLPFGRAVYGVLRFLRAQNDYICPYSFEKLK